MSDGQSLSSTCEHPAGQSAAHHAPHRGFNTQRYNRLKQTDGALFRGRYKAILIDSDAYLLHAGKYIHQNPLSAKLVQQLDHYPWSSYPAYVNKVPNPAWLSRSMTYSMLTESRKRAKRYRIFVEDTEVDGELSRFYTRKHISAVLGDEAFQERLAKELNTMNPESPQYQRVYMQIPLDRIVTVVAEYFGVEEAAVLESKRGRGQQNYPRKVAMYLAQRVGNHKLNAIAAYFGLRHYGSVGAQISLMKAHMKKIVRPAGK